MLPFTFFECMNLETIHTTRNGNLLTGNPCCIIGSKKYGNFRNIFGLTSATKRCIGNKHFFIASLPVVTPALLAPSVSVAPGKIELTRMFFAPSSFDKETVMASNAALVAEYNETPAIGILLAPELILMILLPFIIKQFQSCPDSKYRPKTLTLKC
jgi:hypothetical protein